MPSGGPGKIHFPRGLLRRARIQTGRESRPPDPMPRALVEIPLRSSAPATLLLLGLAGLASGCGAGTVAVLGSSDDSGGGGASAVLTSLTIERPKVSPATLRLGASAGKPVAARLF